MRDDLTYEKHKVGEAFVCENEHAFCVLNHEPLNDGHVMIIPKRFVEELGELNKEEAFSFLQLCDQARKALDSIFSDKSIVFQNCVSWRSQPRLHVHVLPFNAGLRHIHPLLEELDYNRIQRKRLSKEELSELTERLAAAFSE